MSKWNIFRMYRPAYVGGKKRSQLYFKDTSELLNMPDISYFRSFPDFSGFKTTSDRLNGADHYILSAVFADGRSVVVGFTYYKLDIEGVVLADGRSFVVGCTYYKLDI